MDGKSKMRVDDECSSRIVGVSRSRMRGLCLGPRLDRGRGRVVVSGRSSRNWEEGLQLVVI